MKTIAILATMDTKHIEVSYARNLIEALGHAVRVIDIGVSGKPAECAGAIDIQAGEVLHAAGLSLDTITRMDKGARIETMSGAAAIAVAERFKRHEFDAIFSLGGIQNTIMAATAMRALPVGVPKLILSTMASGKRLFGPFVGAKDIVVMHSVADISGINRITRSVIANAVGAVVGMALYGSRRIEASDALVIGATMLGVTSGGVSAATARLQQAGYETISFHATGVGGRAMEHFIADGVIGAALDLTLHEISSELFGGYCAGANDRLLAAAAAGIPQVVAPGAVDILSCSTDFGIDSFPSNWRARKSIAHNASLYHVKLSAAEIVQVAAVIAERLNQAAGPLTVLIPKRGFCEAGAPGRALHDAAIDAAFVTALRRGLKRSIRWVEADLNIAQPEFGELAAAELQAYLQPVEAALAMDSA